MHLPSNWLDLLQYLLNPLWSNSYWFVMECNQKTFFNCRCAVCETETGEPYHTLFLETFLLLRSKEKLKCFIIFLSFSYADIS